MTPAQHRTVRRFAWRNPPVESRLSGAFLDRCDDALDRLLTTRELSVDPARAGVATLGAATDDTTLSHDRLLSLASGCRPPVEGARTPTWEQAGSPEAESWLRSAARLAAVFWCATWADSVSARPFRPEDASTVQDPRVQPVSDVEDAAQRVADLVEAHGFAGTSVLVKPNLVSWEPPPTTSDPHLVSAVLERLQAIGCSPWVTDSPSLFHDADAVLTAFVTRGGPPVSCLDDAPFVTLDGLLVAQPAVAAPCVVNLAQLKGHAEAGYTGAVKNLFAALADFLRLRDHRGGDLRSAITATAATVPWGVHVVDARQVLIGAQQVIRGGNAAAGPGLFVGELAEAVDETALRASLDMGLDIGGAA